jgi:phosphatidylinositol alpha-mannosyltransferase
MRIIQVSPYSWDALGGVQVHIRQLTRHLQRRGHEVLVLAPGDTPGFQDDAQIIGRTLNIRTNGSVARLTFAPSALDALEQAMRDFAPDVVHVHEPFALSIGLKAVWSSPAPVVGTFHSYFARDTWQGRLYTAVAPLLRPTWQRVASRIAVSQAARHSAKGRLGKGNVKIVPNGVDVERFSLATPATGLPEGRKLLFVGRLEARKGLRFAIGAFAQLADRYPDLQLLVVGDGPERHAVNTLAPALRSRVHMLGRVSDELLPRYHRAADLFLAPATGAESFGIVLVEAMAAGLPIVASDIPGYREVARQGREALLVAPSNATALAQGIAQLLDHPDERARLGANGLWRAHEFAWEHIVDELEAIYRSLAGAGRDATVMATA